MAKIKKIFYCSNCGVSSPKWLGQCHSCGEWNTFTEEIVQSSEEKRTSKKSIWNEQNGSASKAVPLASIEASSTKRSLTGDTEFDRVLGGGIVPGALILIGGQPGIGKSTLMLQIAVRQSKNILYVSGEESAEQIKMRADRVEGHSGDCLILTETKVEQILNQAKSIKPDFLVIDSIQTLVSMHIDSIAGSISQIKECAASLQRFAKESNIPVFIIGHINKEGSIAGPKILEHIVDTVLQFEGDRNYTYRILRTLKNRFGSTDELGIYQMETKGLKPVHNPSELLLSQKDEDLSGSAVAATIEGLRPMLIETQGLVSKAVYGNPQRSATGFDLRRLNMLLAVLEKRCGFPLGNFDVFLNIAGGIRVVDPAIDLAIISSIISSFQDVAIPADVCFAGEVGLSGEIRAVNRIEQRVQEADRLGFKQIFVSSFNTKGLDLSRFKIRVRSISKIEDLYEGLFV